MPESKVDEELTRCLTSCVLLGWVDGVLWPLPSVALSPTLQGLGMRMSIEAHQMDPPNELSCLKTQNLGGRGHLQKRNGCDLP